MGSFTSLHYHIVFSTKHRKPTIKSKWKTQLHEYLGGTVNGLGGISQGVGGTNDHVHLLIGLKSTHCLSDFMRELKKASSAWGRQQIGAEHFTWQEGYGAFSVGPNARDEVKRYIANQEKHHQTKSSREEFEELLNRAGVEWEPNWLE